MKNSSQALLASMAVLGALGASRHDQPPAQSYAHGCCGYYGGPLSAKQEKARKASKAAKKARKRNR